MGEIERLMNRGEIRVALVIPEGMSRDLRSGRIATVQVLINGDNANTATTVFGYAQAIVRGVSARCSCSWQAGGRPRRPSRSQPRIWYNPELQSTLFLVPGLIAFIVMISAVVSTSLSIVREKERGTWEQVRMAPISTPCLRHRQDDSLLLHLAGLGVPHHRGVHAALRPADARARGSCCCSPSRCSSSARSGTGLLVSTLVDSQALAFLIGLLISLLPTFILSGFIFPIASMPRPIQVHHGASCRPGTSWSRCAGIVLKGVGVRRRWRRSSPRSALYAFIVLALASIRLAKERG